MRDPIVRDALMLTATTNAIALAVILLVGTPAAYLLGTRRFRGREIVITLVELPLVLPPTVAGHRAAGGVRRVASACSPTSFQRIGVDVVFTTTAVVIAICFVAGPFFLRQAIAAFETLDRDVLDAARVDGASPLPRARSASASRSPRPASPPAPRSRSRAASASSARRSCSPATCAASRRRCRC